MLFNYTSELRNYIEQQSPPSPPLSHRELIEAGRLKLFDFEYPIFDEAYRGVFETHFIRKFYMRQIGFETFGLFKFQLETWLIINMGYFNKLFESELLVFDPLTNWKTDVASTKTTTKTQNDIKTGNDSKIINGETNTDSSRMGTAINNENSSIVGNNQGTQSKDETGTLTDDGFNRQLESNNPDSRLTLTAENGVGVIEYASSIKENKENTSKSNHNTETNSTNDNSSVNSEKEATISNQDNLIDNTKSNIVENDTKNDTFSSNITNVDDYVLHSSGKNGLQSVSKMLQDYRDTLIRIENMIFTDMNELFMLVY